MITCDFFRLSPRRRLRPKMKHYKTVARGSIKKQFSRFLLCDSLLSCFSKTMIELQLSNLDKGAAKGLCIQFILHEYAKALKITAHLPNSSPEDALIDLEKLFANSSNSPIVHQPGVLDKLCFYCEALVQSSKIGENLLGTIDELRILASLSRTQLSREIRSIPITASTSGVDSLKDIEQKLRGFFTLLSPIFQECLDSESALFSLLELRDVLNWHLGERTVEKLLAELFPKGPEMLRQTLIDGFSRRGFSDFCERHESLFCGLTWPTIAPSHPKP